MITVPARTSCAIFMMFPAFPGRSLTGNVGVPATIPENLKL
jgi:hypothetical protein